MKQGWKQVWQIFKPPYLKKNIHIFTILFLGLLGYNTVIEFYLCILYKIGLIFRENTLRLWLPQLFTKIDEYHQTHNFTESTNLCNMLDMSSNNASLNLNLSEMICIVVRLLAWLHLLNVIIILLTVFPVPLFDTNLQPF